MSAINENHVYGGAVYKGHTLNGVMPFNRLLFMRSNHFEIDYVDTSTGNTIDTETANLEYDRDDDPKIFNLSFIRSAVTLGGYTDQYMQADKTKMQDPTVPLGIADITTYNNQNVITYNIAPIKTTGTIYINFIYNQTIIDQEPIIGNIDSTYTNNPPVPQGYTPETDMGFINSIPFTYQPQYENIIVTKAGD